MGCLIGEYCDEHEFVHGQEAEELRAGLEALVNVEGRDDVSVGSLQRLLDSIDARDSLAYLESKEKVTP